MNDQMNAPMSSMPSGSGPTPFYQVWINALTKPNEQTFAEMAASPNAKATTAYLWVFAGSLIQIFLSALVQSAMMRNLLQQLGSNGSRFTGGGIGARLIGAICGAPVGAVITTLFFAIGVFIIQWIAKMFGGKGTSDQLAYVMASIAAPYSIIAGVFTLLSAIPFVGLCFSVIVGIAGLYILVLQVMAIKGVNQFGWGQAIGSLFIPGLVVGFLCACLVGGSLMILGPAIRNAFQQLNP